MNMDAKELAGLLNGRGYLDEISRGECIAAKEAGLVVVFGQSDDLCELRGAVDDEIGCYDGGTIYLDADGVFQSDCEDTSCKLMDRHLKTCRTIEICWGEDGYSWIYKTDIPHETFEIMDDGEKYCRGMVFRWPLNGASK